MAWMNEYEIDEAVEDLEPVADEFPRLAEAAAVLQRLKNWTNGHSDGWPYWQKPSRAANRLMEALNVSRLQVRFRPDLVEDMTDAELKAALRPIKAFLTRQGVPHVVVLND